MSGDIIDLEERRKKLREFAEQKSREEEEDILEPCPECGDTLFYLSRIPNTPLDDPYGVFCQHCIEPVGYAYFFPPDDEE